MFNNYQKINYKHANIFNKYYNNKQREYNKCKLVN